MKHSDQALTNALRQALGAAKPQPRTNNASAYAAQKQSARERQVKKK